MDWFSCEQCGHDRHRDLPLCAECGIDGIGDLEHANLLLDALSGGRSIRRSASDAIRAFIDPRGLPAFEAHLRDSSAPEREVAAAALASIAAPSSFELMTSLPAIHPERVRYLARLGTAEAQELLFSQGDGHLPSILGLAATGDSRSVNLFLTYVDRLVNRPFALTEMGAALPNWGPMLEVNCEQMAEGLRSQALWLLDLDARIASQMTHRDEEWMERRRIELQEEPTIPSDLEEILGDDEQRQQFLSTARRLQKSETTELDPEHWRSMAIASTAMKLRSVHALLEMLAPDSAADIRRQAAELGLMSPAIGAGEISLGGRSLLRVETPDTREPITRFGAQPTWIEEPAWPIGPDGKPMAFWAQFQLPWMPGSLAYLFISNCGDEVTSADGSAALFVQPGSRPDGEWLPNLEGPLVAVDGPCDDSFGAPSHKKIRPAVPSLKTIELIDGARQKEDWMFNRIGGEPRWLQGDGSPGAEWRFLFQFSAALMGPELADVAECYGFIHEDGRGDFSWQCH